jgi:hypothetical protein
VRASLLLASGSTGAHLVRGLPRRVHEVLVEDLAVGPYSVEVAAPGLLGTGGAVVEAVASPGAPSTLKLLHGRTVRGRVLLRRWVERADAPPGPVDLPVERGHVALLDGDPLRAPCLVPIEPDGTFVLDGLPQGPVLLCAGVPGLPAHAQVVDGDTADLHLEGPAEAAVRVTGEDGAPLPAAGVRIATEDGVDLRDLVANGRFRGVVAADTDADDVLLLLRLDRDGKGRIAAPFLHPGSYRFTVTAEGHEAVQVGVRARTKGAEAQIWESLGGEDGYAPEARDLARPVRLSRAKG